MGKKVEKEKNELVEEFFRRNDPKDIKSMGDMYAAWKEFFAPAFQNLARCRNGSKTADIQKMKEPTMKILGMDIILKELFQLKWVISLLRFLEIEMEK